MAEPLRRKLVVVEESVLVALANNAAAVKEFPFLKSVSGVQARGPGCGTCSRRSTARNTTMGSLKQTLASMDSSRKRRLKELLNAQQIRITYRNGNRMTQLTF